MWGHVLAHRRGEAAALTVDHVPMLASERARIEASGGMVTKHLPYPPTSPIPYPLCRACRANYYLNALCLRVGVGVGVNIQIYRALVRWRRWQTRRLEVVRLY